MDEFRSEFCTEMALRCGVRRRYAGITMDDFVITHSAQEDIKDKIVNIINNYQDSSDNFIFIGDKGTGKTFTAVLLVKELFRKMLINNFEYINLHTYLSECKQSFDRKDGNYEPRTYYADVEFLILDEFGSYPITQYDYQLLFELLDARYSDELKTCIITNMKNSEELVQFMNPAIADRVFESIDIIRFGGISLRSKYI